MTGDSGAWAGVRFSLNCSLSLNHVPLRDRNSVAADLGFTAVEHWWPFSTPTPSDTEVDTFVQSVRAAGLRLTALNFPAGDMAAGDRGILSNAAAMRDFRAGVRIAVEIGSQLGTTVFNALYGRTDSPAYAPGVALENLQFAIECARPLGALVVVEPLSGVDSYPLKTARDALALLDQAGCSHAGLLADLYHLAANGDDLDAVIEAHTGRIGHVQIADHPGRGAPGRGLLPIAAHLAHLRERGYVGYVGLEFVSSGDIDADLEWLPRVRRADQE